MAKLISVPKTPASAYDPDRRVSSLLRAHVDNLVAVVRRKHGLVFRPKPRSEGQAAAVIRELTPHLHPQPLAARPFPADMQASGPSVPRRRRPHAKRRGKRTAGSSRRRRA